VEKFRRLSLKLVSQMYKLKNISLNLDL